MARVAGLADALVRERTEVEQACRVERARIGVAGIREGGQLTERALPVRVACTRVVEQIHGHTGRKVLTLVAAERCGRARVEAHLA